MIYFTSDLHYNHLSALIMCRRPFKSVEEMNKALLNNWNNTVQKNDTVYILGDLSHKTPVETVNEFIRKLNGKKILIKGNHDKNYDETLFEEIVPFKEINYSGICISLMHYPMLEWPKSRHGSIHLHGHQHNKAEYNERMREEGIRRYDVGVDANNFKPVSIYEILNFMNKYNHPIFKGKDEIIFNYKGNMKVGIVKSVDKNEFGYYTLKYSILFIDENKLSLAKHIKEKDIKRYEGKNLRVDKELSLIKEKLYELTKKPSF